MEKLTFDGVTIEITRRCDMECGHCCRGDSQAVDIDPKHLDAFFDQCEVIGSLAITGGEPLLYIDALQHLYDGICERGIMLLEFGIVSNGHTFSERFVDVLKHFGDLVWACNYLCRPNLRNLSREDFISLCGVGISLDQYHADHDICLANYKKYKKALAGCVDVHQTLHGNVVNGLGRSKSLLEKPVDFSKIIDEYSKRQIELFSAEYQTPVCESLQGGKLALVHPNQKRVLCNLYLDSFGYLKSDAIGSSSYRSIDAFPPICTVYDPIWESLIDYNRGRIQCAAFNKTLIDNIEETCNDEETRSILLQKVNAQNNKPEAQDEPPMLYKKTFKDTLNAIVTKKIKEEMMSARQKARELFPNVPEKEILKALPFSAADVPLIVAMISRSGNYNSDDEIEQYVSTDFKTTYRFIMEDNSFSDAEKDVVKSYMRVMARYFKKEKNQEPYNFEEQGLFTKLEQLEHLYKAESKSVRCVRCQKVIRHDGRNIHCTEGSGGLICDYCGGRN